MAWVWYLVVAGVVVIAATVLLQRKLKPKLDLVIRGGGYTLDESQKAIRMVQRHGRVPADARMRQLAIEYATKGAHNLRYVWWTAPALFLGYALVSMVVSFGDNAWFLVVPLLLLFWAVLSLVMNLRALKNSRRVVAEHARAS